MILRLVLWHAGGRMVIPVGESDQKFFQIDKDLAGNVELLLASFT